MSAKRPQLAILVGVQACGKSSFVRENFFDSHVRINLDMLRTRARESKLFAACLDAKQSLVVDNTNASAADRARYVEPARAAHFEVVGYYFSSSIKEALRRNAARSGKARVPDAAVKATHSRLEIPTLDEGFDALYYVKLGNDGFVIEEWCDEV